MEEKFFEEVLSDLEAIEMTEEDKQNSAVFEEVSDDELEEVAGGRVINISTGACTSEVEAYNMVAASFRVNYIYMLKQSRRKVVCTALGTIPANKSNTAFYGVVYYQLLDSNNRRVPGFYYATRDRFATK